jgi:hypothetical protein
MLIFFNSGSKKQDRLRQHIRKRQEHRYIDHNGVHIPKLYICMNCSKIVLDLTFVFLSENNMQFSNGRRIFYGQDFGESNRPNVKKVFLLELRVGIQIITIQPVPQTLTPAS